MRENLQQMRNILLENATIPVERRTLFLKTREGEYGEHDRFIGVTVPTLRTIAKSYYNLNMEDLSRFITSEFNEERFLALAILIMQYQTAQDKEFLYNFYLNNIKHVN
ncbi:MAG: DNA alkylation repair protein [Rickettsia conorii subsp. raoultii]|nr:DNA alkylation repair protein [Rickettsia conorii]